MKTRLQIILDMKTTVRPSGGGKQSLSKFGRGRKLDNHAHIQVNHAHSLNFGTSSFTIMGWLKYRYVTYPRTTFGIIKGHYCYKKTVGSPHPVWETGHRYNSQSMRVCIQDHSGNMVDKYLRYNSENQPKDLLNTWNHHAFVFDRKLKKILAYVNGKMQDDTVDIGTVTGSVNNNQKLKIGELHGWYVRGQVDEFRMYNQALCGREIYQTYKNKA